MTVFTFHIANTTIGTTVRALYRPPTRQLVPGLNHTECMAMMTLGAPILSPARMQLHHLTMFAAWESDAAIDAFLAGTRLGRALATGWHVRMAFLRRWGYISELDGLAESVGEQDPAAPVVAVTLARMKFPQRHIAAMAERQRKDFHFEFTTLRFRPIAEYGSWEGRTHIVPS